MDHEIFEHPIVVVYQRSRAELGAILSGPRLITVGSRTFLTGTAVAREGHWASNRPVYLAWDDIVYVVGYDSEESYFASLPSRRRRWFAGSSKRRRRDFLRNS